MSGPGLVIKTLDDLEALVRIVIDNRIEVLEFDGIRIERSAASYNVLPKVPIKDSSSSQKPPQIIHPPTEADLIKRGMR